MRHLFLLFITIFLGACQKYEYNPYLAGQWQLDNVNCGLSFTQIRLTKDGYYETNNNQTGRWYDNEGIIDFNGTQFLIGLGDYRNMVIRDTNQCNSSFNKVQ